VVGEAADAAEVQMLVRTTHPHMLLLEWSLPGANPTTLIPQLKQLARLTIIVVSSDPFVLSEAEKAGADGVISKADSPDKLLILLRSLIGKSE
jgi:DNA-binding NarL/FixJ family response regulator